MSWFRYLYQNMFIRIGKSRGKPNLGIFQGNKLSCVLFILYLGEMMCEYEDMMVLKDKTVDTKRDTLWVDDIVMVLKAKELVRHYRKLVMTAEEFGFKFKVKADGTKTAVMRIKAEAKAGLKRRLTKK